MVMVAHKKGGRLAWAEENKAMPNVWRQSKPRDSEHPNAKPTELPQAFIEAITQRSEIVLDPYMGSGTTGIACIRTGRLFLGVEIDPHYFDIAVDRIKRELAQPYIPALAPEKAVEQELSL